MVARVAGRVDDKAGIRPRKGRRATIKALPEAPTEGGLQRRPYQTTERLASVVP